MQLFHDAKIKYFLYARKSHESEDRQVQSLDDQIRVLRDFAEKTGLQIVETLIEAKSAKLPGQRPVFSNMLARIEKGEAQGILCWQINRLSRNPVESGTISWLLQQGVIKCIQTMDRKYSPDDNVLILSVESGMANQFIIDLRKNIKRGMDGKAERGWFPVKPPVGYKNDPENDRGIIPDPDRFHLVKKMWELMLTGAYTPHEILQTACESWGFTIPLSKKSTNACPTRSSIYNWFGNIFYAGKFEWNGKLYQGKHTAMVTMAEFERVQELLGKGEHSSTFIHDFAYTGLIRCGVCGCQYTASEKQKLVKTLNEYRTYTYYHCTRKRKTVPCNPANQKPLSLSDLEKQLQVITLKFALPDDVTHLCLKILEREIPRAEVESEKMRDSMQKTLNTYRKELENLNRMLYRDLIGEEFYEKEKKQLLRKIDVMEEEIENGSDGSKNMERAIGAFQLAAASHRILTDGTPKEKKGLLLKLGSNYRIEGEKLLFDKEKWLDPIEKNREFLMRLFSRLELGNSLDVEGLNGDIEPFRLKLSRVLYEIRTNLTKPFD